MSVMVKRFFIFGMLFGIFFASCSYNSGSNLTTSCSIEVDKDFVSGMRSVLQKSYSDTTQVRVNIECTGGYETSKWYDATIGTLPGVVFSFEEVPFDKTFSIYVGVYQGSELIYEAKKEDVIIKSENPVIELSMILKSIYDFAKETKIVVWNSIINGIETTYDLYTLKSPSASLKSSFASDLNHSTFFFDAPGNVWYPVSEQSGNNYVTKLKSDTGNEIDFSDVFDTGYTQFACVREFNILYCVTVESDADYNNRTIVLYRFPNVLTDTNSKICKKYILSINDSSVESMLSWPAVFYDGTTEKFYAVSQGEEGLLLFEFNLTGKDDGNTVIGEQILNLSEEINDVFNDNYLCISDLICYEDAIYILVKEPPVDNYWMPASPNLRNRGFIMKYDISTGELKNAGFSSDEIANTEIEKMYCYFKNGDTFKITYKDRVNTEYTLLEGAEKLNNAEVKVNTIFPSICSPKTIFSNSKLNLSTSAFYGPAKIIGLKPKKLVIADDGYAFYVDENGGLSFKNVNRIVTVDLETFAMAFNETSATFDEENKLFRTYSIISANGGDSSIYYTSPCYVGDSSYEVNNCYIGIRNTDGE